MRYLCKLISKTSKTLKSYSLENKMNFKMPFFLKDTRENVLNVPIKYRGKFLYTV